MTPYQQGKQAFADYVACGYETYTPNPFPKRSKEYASFERGFNAADRAMERDMIKDGMT